MNSNFLVDGFAKNEKFFSAEEVNGFNDELDGLLKTQSINSSKGYMRISDCVRTIPFPFAFIRRTNLVQVVNRVCESLGSHNLDMKDYFLSEAQVYSEQGDHDPLVWHTDHSNGGILALLYLKGGDDDSGGAQYIKGTHTLKHDRGLHHVPQEQLDSYKSSTINLSGKAGDLVLYFLNGFHSRHPTLRERRVLRLMFEKNTEDHSRFDDIVLPISSLQELNVIPSYLKSHKKTVEFKEIHAGFSYIFENPPVIRFKTVLNLFGQWLGVYRKRLLKRLG